MDKYETEQQMLHIKENFLSHGWTQSKNSNKTIIKTDEKGQKWHVKFEKMAFRIELKRLHPSGISNTYWIWWNVRSAYYKDVYIASDGYIHFNGHNNDIFHELKLESIGILKEMKMDGIPPQKIQ